MIVAGDAAASDAAAGAALLLLPLLLHLRPAHQADVVQGVCYDCLKLDIIAALAQAFQRRHPASRNDGRAIAGLMPGHVDQQQHCNSLRR
jgi:hypothetical protein